MKILHLIPSLGGGGSERQLVLLAVEQVRRGHEIHVGTARDGVWAPALESTGARVHPIPNRGSHDPLIPVRIAQLIRKIDPAVVHTWLRQMDICGGIAALALQRAWVLSERSSEDAYPATWKHWTRTHLASRANAIVSNSEPGNSYWERHVGQTVRRFIVKNGVDFDGIQRAPMPGSDAAIPSDRPIVLVAGRLMAGKNLPVLQPALERVVGGGDAVALVCGDGPERDNVRRWVSARGLEDSIRLLGFRRDLWSIMKVASVAVSISRFEGHPNTVIEAMTAGCPLVVSDIAAHREFLDEDCAVFVPLDDPAAVARGIQGVLAEPVRARARAERARIRAQQYSVPRAVAEYEDIYKAVLAADGRRARRAS